MEPLTLHREGLVLSVPTSDDVDDITAACRDPQVAAWTTVPQPYTRQHAENFVHEMVRPGWAIGRNLTWAVREPERLVAMIGLDDVADGGAEIGFWVAPWGRGRGVMTAAVAAVLDHAFAPDGLDLVRVGWRAFVGNWPSRRVAWRAGFRFEGTLRLEGVQRDLRRDHWVAGLLRDDPRRPVDPWPAEAPSDNRAVPPEVPGVPVDPATRGRMGA